MAKFVPDIKTQRWIVISPTRLSRPDSGVAVVKKCPFCPGNEALTTLEILRSGAGEKNMPGWSIRVIPNKFPITDFHEVIIHSPDHDKDIIDFDIPHIIELLTIYRARFLFYKDNGQVIIFSNHGEHAGASLAHAHSQLVVIPRQINLDALVREPVLNVIEEAAHHITYCPDFSQWPYEVWITPKNEGIMFCDSRDEELKDLSVVFQKALQRLYAKYNMMVSQKVHGDVPFAYNYYIHHAKNWFIRIIPRLIHRAGFELGTGLSVNVVDPTIAAQELKEIQV